MECLGFHRLGYARSKRWDNGCRSRDVLQRRLDKNRDGQVELIFFSEAVSRVLKMLLMLSKIPTAYACCAILALIAIGFILNGLRPHIPMLSGNAGQIAFGVSQIVSGLIILALTYVIVRRVWL